MRYRRFFIFLLFFQRFIYGTWFDAIPRVIVQPDGDKIGCFITGDQYVRRLHDVNNFTIILNIQDGFYYYADKNSNGDLIPSDLILGEGNPENHDLEPGYSVSQEEYNRKKQFYDYRGSNHVSRDAPNSGEIAQINVFIRFADDPEFPFPRSHYDAVFQTDEDEPSLRDYFWEVSYNNLLVNTFHYPGTFDGSNTAYIDEYNRNYYMPYSNANPEGYDGSAERTEREHTLLANAINSISSSVSPFIDVDADDDGLVDAVSFVIYGTPGDWADLLWPHRWALYSQNVYINNSQVYDYLFMLSESWYFNVGVLCHEFGHVLGAPDYYHYDGGGAPTPVGGWDVMASNGNPPQFPSAFTKWKYFDWIEPVEIFESGTYTLYPLDGQENVMFKIPSVNSEAEYFVVEYRRQEGVYDSNAPGPRSGLVAYRVNTEAGDGNAQGPPDELYVYRPGGDLNNNGNFEQAPYSTEYSHTQLNDNTDPSSFLYNEGLGADGGLNLYNVTDAGETISFTVSFGIPELSVNPNNLTYNLDAGEYDVQTITVTNIGEPETVLNFEATVTNSESFINPQGGPDGGNYYWTTSDEEPDLNYDWIDIEGLGVQLNFPGNDDFSSEQISLPFEFPFFGISYDYLHVNANGWVGWNSANETLWQNGDIPSASMPRPAIFGFFDDLNPENDNGNSSASGNIYYHVDQDSVVVWFNDVVRWEGDSGGGIYDFQIILFSNGRLKCNYRNMVGTTNQATIGWQDSFGNEGTQLSTVGESFVSNNFTWEAKAYSQENIPWIILTSDNGIPAGSLYGNESSSIYAQALTLDLSQGDYLASINIISPETDPVAIPVTLTVNGDNLIPTLPYIDISSSETGIIDLPNDVDPMFISVASRYTHVVASNGDLIPFLIQENFTDEQVLHARRVLESYLTNIPDSQWGNDKDPISNAIGATNAILFLLNDENEYENPDLWLLMDAGVIGQDLLATEVFPEGSSEYMNSSERDATYEEILHYVHDYGIKLASPGMQVAIESAMDIAISNGYYNPLSDLPEDDYDEEYLAMGLECYFGLWAHDPSGDGYCGDQEYAYINRELMEAGDPALHGIISGFLGEVWEYTAILPETFVSEFYLHQENNLDYTFRSKYLRNIALTGEASSVIYGNEYLNILHGNDGDNQFTGFSGDDVLFGSHGVDRAIYEGDREEYVIIPPYATDDSSFQILDIQPDRDGTDHLYDIEEVAFNDIVYNIIDLLAVNNNFLPKKFALFSPYPNPFNPITKIGFDIAEPEVVSLKVFDLNGRLVRTLNRSKLGIGKYVVEWDAKDDNGYFVTSGVYFIHFISNSYANTKKVLFIK